ncbi:MAG: hypothetical protein U9Q98_08745 [Bacteroidota bacterium]|nr:hypothetical protein [Bacteroidota bacterium]
MKVRLIILLALPFFLLMAGCGQTEEDLRMEEDIIGYWIAKDSNGDPENSIPRYMFGEDNEGYTELSNAQDSMTWEIKRGELKVYYDKAPDYIIGYDKYNSRSLFMIHKLEDDYLKVTQYYNDGFQADLNFYRQ